VTTISQRDLRNHVSEVLQRAEAGEQFTITVDGRPVATLGPLAVRWRAAPPERLRQILADVPVDPGWPAEVERLRATSRW
jgi:prevent-host-death family protein